MSIFAAPDQVLSVAQMRGAEAALIAAGVDVDELMLRAGRGVADYVWRMAAGRPVTVLVGPGNNGGDGWVVAEAIREMGGAVVVVAAYLPRTDAARRAQLRYGGDVLPREAVPHGAVLVDCLFGSGLTRGLAADDAGVLARLAASHALRIAVDVPSGVDSDSGAPLNADLPEYDLTLALGAWKPAHFLMPACVAMGALRLVGIGCGVQAGGAGVVRRPKLCAPAPDAHKYRRGLLGVVAGAMPGAALLAARGAQLAGAGYVKILGEDSVSPPDLVPPDLVIAGPDALGDARMSALLVGPGLGRDGGAGAKLAKVLAAALAAGRPMVIDADGLMLLTSAMLTAHTAPIIATPHEGELAALERAFGLANIGGKPARARALAAASGMVVVAKGPDTVICAPDGTTLFCPRASSWLSTAGTGDVLAGCIASRLAMGALPIDAAAQGVWLHGAAAKVARGPFTAAALAEAVASAYRAAL